MVKKLISVCAIVLFIVGCGSDIVGKVNGRDITKEEFEAYLKFKRIPEQDEKKVSAALQDYLQREALADMIEDNSAVDAELLKVELNEFRKQMLISRHFEKHLDDVVSEEAIANYYNTHPQEYENEKIKAAHILIRTHNNMSEAERNASLTKAQEAYSVAQTGRDFAEVAAQYSEDNISAKQGGSLGWIRKGAIDPVFSDRVFAMRAGDISEPFATPFGFHVVKVLEAPQVIKTPFEKVTGDIRYRLRQEAKHAEKERLLGKAKIKETR